MKKHTQLARRKMSRVIDELYAALFHLGGETVDFQLRREEKGLRLTARGDFSPENRRRVERMAEVLRPAVRRRRCGSCRAAVTGCAAPGRWRGRLPWCWWSRCCWG